MISKTRKIATNFRSSATTAMILGLLLHASSEAPRAADSAPGTPAVTLESLIRELSDLVRLAAEPDPRYVSALSSSYNRISVSPKQPGWFANKDFGNFVAVEDHDGMTEYVLLDAEGPGAVTRIWSANPTGTLRVYLDNESQPAIEVPMRSLMSGAHAPFVSPLAHRAVSGHNFYFPIPYGTHCKITTDDGQNLYYHVEYRTYDAQAEVETFTIAAATALEPLIASVAEALSNPDAVYEPSPDHQHITGRLTVNRGEFETVAAEVSGPDAIVRELRLRPSRIDDDVLRGVLLEIGFDGERRVQAPLGDFFGSGPGLNPYESLPFSVGGDGTLVARWPMPFRRSISLGLSSRLSGPLTVEYELFVEPHRWTPRSYYFNAGWRADHQVYAHPARDWDVVEIEGSGSLVGTALNVASPFVSFWDWWGEGDHKIWVDDDEFPSHFGTGTEDYFGYAWGTCVPFDETYHNQTRWDGPNYYGHTSVNRWHIADPIPFEFRLDFDLGQLVWANDEKAVLYDAMVYWYASPRSTDDLPRLTSAELTWPPLPARQEKQIPGFAIEGESMGVLSQVGVAFPRSMAPFEIQGRVWSQQTQRSWIGGNIGDRLELEFQTPGQGDYCAHAYMTLAGSHGTFQLDVNGVPVADPIDLTTPGHVAPTEAVKLGQVAMTSGPNRLGATVIALAQGAGCGGCEIFGLDAISLIDVDEPIGAPWLSVGRQEISWQSAANAVTYDLVSGDLQTLVATGGDYELAIETCLADGHSGSSVKFKAEPETGRGMWFLLRGAHCSSGSFDSGGSGQAVPRDVSIAAAPGSCR